MKISRLRNETSVRNRRKYFLAVPSVIIAGTMALSACSEAPVNNDAGGGSSDTGNGDSNPPLNADSDSIRIGVLSTLEGPFTALGEDSNRGAKLAMIEYGGTLDGKGPRDGVSGVTVGGKQVDFVFESSDGSTDVALEAARRLVEQQQVDILVGPSSGDEGIGVKEYANTQPDHTFINGSSAATETTLFDTADNFFRFNGDGGQWIAGLGTYVANELGYKKIATVAEDYSYPYAQVGTFQYELCKAGGEVVEKAWVPIGTSDYASIVQQIPSDVDAVFVAVAGTDAVNFVEQYDSFTGGEVPLVAASSTIDGTTLQELGDRMVGVPAAAPAASNIETAEWEEFVDLYRENFPDGLDAPSLFGYLFYTNMKATLMALDQVDGDLSDGHQAYRQALSDLVIDSPTGQISLDENRNGVVPNFVFEIEENESGVLTNKVLETVPDVGQTLGLSLDEYLDLAPFERDFTCDAE